MTDEEIRSRLDRIKKYNAYFSEEKDSEGKSLTAHIVGPHALWRIMTVEWGIKDPRKFGIADPGPIPEWNPNAPKKQPVGPKEALLRQLREEREK